MLSRMINRSSRMILRKQLAVASVFPTLLACLAPTTDSLFQSPLFPVRSHQFSAVRSLKIRTAAKSDKPPVQEDIDDETSWYASPDHTVDDEESFEEDKVNDYVPPDFTVINDDGDESNEPLEALNDAPSSRHMPLGFTVDDDDDDDEGDDLAPSLEAAETEVKVEQPRKKTAAIDVEKLQATSWMEKNAINPSLQEPEQPKKSQKQKERGQERRTDNRTFRQDFRETRVFVQGLPLDTTWQQLKDHFKLAGDVVFASVSIDPRTGKSKGCGVVQFETMVMAQEAIANMRFHPLNGAKLYVREDVQEGKEGARLRSPLPLGGGKTSTIPVTWNCADENTLELLSEDERTAIYSLIRAREDARKRRNYDASDEMREDLKFKYSVHLDDRLKMWWVSPDDRKVPQSISDINGDGRWGSLKAWRQIPSTPENDACINPDMVNGLLTQRDVARREKDFSTADALLEKARTSPDGDLTLRIRDDSRTWRVWTEKPPPRELMYGSRSDRQSPAEQCIDIVREHEPEKIAEIEKLLEKFPGREYAILKKIKQQYLKR